MPERRRDLREAVDEFLRAEKAPVGEAAWTPSDRDGDVRAKWPLAIAGEISEASLTIKAYPRSTPLQFRVVLSYVKAVWRLDFIHTDGHINSLNRPADLPPGPLNEPHVHTWPLNRRFATMNSLPDELENAMLLARNIRSFESAFRWFCGETHIRLEGVRIPDLPRSDRLL